MSVHVVWMKEIVEKEVRHLVYIDEHGGEVNVYDTIDQVNIVSRDTELLGAELAECN